MRKIFKYIEPLWLGNDGKISLRSSLAIFFSGNLMYNLSHAVFKWESSRTMTDLAMTLGIEAGLIAALLTLTTYQNVAANAVANAQPQPTTVTVQNAETVTSQQPVKAEVVNTRNIQTVNTQTTNVEEADQIRVTRQDD